MTKNFTNRQGGGQKLNKLRRKVGAILIEFAFAIPIFLVLIYYIHDLPKQKLMQRKAQFVAYEIAAILQNIATQKRTSGRITKDDLNNAVRLANLSIFPGVTQYSTNNDWTGVPLKYFSITRIYYVVMTAENTAEVKWCCRLHPQGKAPIYGASVRDSTYLPYETVVKAEKGTPSQICSGLRMSQVGEARIIAEHFLQSIDLSADTGINNPQLFGFLLCKPNDFRVAFRSVAIFTPQGTAFSATAP